MLIDQVQNQLECLYGIGIPQRVADYLINRQQLLHYMPQASQQKIPKELFLVRNPGENTVEVALFFDLKLLKNLKKNDPFHSLNDQNLSDFCILIEGVSHFVYFLWKSEQQLPITQLELELQAEIDKFLMLFFYLRTRHDPKFTVSLMTALFEEFSLHDFLSLEARERYLTASTLASRFCYRLQNKVRREHDLQIAIHEIRDFYRFTQQQKIRHIMQ